MNKHTTTAHHDIGSLAEDVRALMAATADVAGEKVGEARKRLAPLWQAAEQWLVTYATRWLSARKRLMKRRMSIHISQSRLHWELQH